MLIILFKRLNVLTVPLDIIAHQDLTDPIFVLMDTIALQKLKTINITLARSELTSISVAFKLQHLA